MDYIIKFTEAEEKVIRKALVNYVERVCRGNGTVTEVSMMPYLLNIMFPGAGKVMATQVSTPLKS